MLDDKAIDVDGEPALAPPLRIGGCQGLLNLGGNLQ